MKKLKVITIALLFLVTVLPVYASGTGIDVDSGNSFGLGTITLPTFLSGVQVGNFSIISYITLFLNLIFIVIAIAWVLLAVRAGFDWLRSEGSEDMIGQSKKRFGNVFISITFMFGFFVVLILFSSFLGFGNFLTWPKQFSTCADGRYYFQVVLESQQEGIQDADPDRLCDFGSRSVCQENREVCDSRCTPGDAGCSRACRDGYDSCVGSTTDECAADRVRCRAACVPATIGCYTVCDQNFNICVGN